MPDRKKNSQKKTTGCKACINSDIITSENTLEDIGVKLGKVYKKVKISQEPMFAWVQIINCVTVLGENLRRGRNKEAVDSSGKLLMRLLEFIGYYLKIHKTTGDSEFSDCVAKILRHRSYTKYYKANNLQEGPTRWLLAKYPYVCSKCGELPCHCLIMPWVLENRRENPEPYIINFKQKAEGARLKLARKKIKLFTLESLIYHFQGIYKNSHYFQEPWEIGMHLSEELGEATIELSRLELFWRAKKQNYDIRKDLTDIINITQDKINKQIADIVDEEYRGKRSIQIKKELTIVKKKLYSTDPWTIYCDMVGEKLKEEIADVISWVAAVIAKLDEDIVQLKAYPNYYKKTISGDRKVLICPWCQEVNCSDKCLVTHGFSSEITEKVFKF